jgi:hypothetical protein
MLRTSFRFAVHNGSDYVELNDSASDEFIIDEIGKHCK